MTEVRKLSYFCIKIAKRVKQEDIITGLIQLGIIMKAASTEAKYDADWKISEEVYQSLLTVINRQVHYNGWFTKEAVQFSLSSHAEMLQEETLRNFVSNYQYVDEPKNVAVIMAGNIPLVGFHDFICVLLSGNKINAKLSSDDATLLPELVSILLHLDERFHERITLSKTLVKEIDAVIATGSDNSLKYFEEYFGKHPHIFRKNRTSVAVFDGTETKEEIEELGKDIFYYFGLGCRNVSHLLFPKGFELDRFFEGIFSHNSIIHHNKYINNFEYQRAVHLLNQIPVLENGFILLKETTDLHAPLAMVHYHFYTSKEELTAYLDAHREELQVIMGKNYTPFGVAQTPKIDDFADNINTMRFLTNLSK